MIPVCAIKGFNTSTVIESILEKLPESEPYFAKDELTDKPVRFFVAEIIREKILTNYQKEIPYVIFSEDLKNKRKVLILNLMT